ncbi:uncharacterized protein N7469_010014 [Penicillium citrinum]|uniref:Uncharacterized protein n=2 Tax=Penicillium TaxID=5073 RepID=A0A9W9NJK2_PENCI|nr:uncharacterized protein N7469_010014 [Penicillium citrinum]KAJ5221127.1 hypothetical protein N7469_010014 [Penicillium citrinum]KAJ5596091.1 hypothetical protein N7450_002549 [Penicillium hetheringtonii]
MFLCRLSFSSLWYLSRSSLPSCIKRATSAVAASFSAVTWRCAISQGFIGCCDLGLFGLKAIYLRPKLRSFAGAGPKTLLVLAFDGLIETSYLGLIRSDLVSASNKICLVGLLGGNPELTQLPVKVGVVSCKLGVLGLKTLHCRLEIISLILVGLEHIIGGLHVPGSIRLGFHDLSSEVLVLFDKFGGQALMLDKLSAEVQVHVFHFQNAHSSSGCIFGIQSRRDVVVWSWGIHFVIPISIHALASEDTSASSPILPEFGPRHALPLFVVALLSLGLGQFFLQVDNFCLNCYHLMFFLFFVVGQELNLVGVLVSRPLGNFIELLFIKLAHSIQFGLVLSVALVLGKPFNISAVPAGI